MTTDDGLAVPMTDEEAAVLRRARFGGLPDRIRPEDRVELVDVESPTEVPEQAFDAREWGESGRY